MTAPSRGGWEGCHVLCVGVLVCVVYGNCQKLPISFFFFSLFLSLFLYLGWKSCLPKLAGKRKLDYGSCCCCCSCHRWFPDADAHTTTTTPPFFFFPLQACHSMARPGLSASNQVCVRISPVNYPYLTLSIEYLGYDLPT